MTVILSQSEVESEVMRLSGLLDVQVGKVAQRARAAAQARADYKVAFAKAILVAEGKSKEQREAAALLDCEDLYRTHEAADAVLMAAQEAGRSLRSQLDALRSILASVRAATIHSEGVGS